jgi:hypothetical protein
MGDEYPVYVHPSGTFLTPSMHRLENPPLKSVFCVCVRPVKQKKWICRESNPKSWIRRQSNPKPTKSSRTSGNTSASYYLPASAFYMINLVSSNPVMGITEWVVSHTILDTAGSGTNATIRNTRHTDQYCPYDQLGGWEYRWRWRWRSCVFSGMRPGCGWRTPL